MALAKLKVFLTQNEPYTTHIQIKNYVLIWLYLINNFQRDILVYNYCCNIERNNTFLLICAASLTY